MLASDFRSITSPAVLGGALAHTARGRRRFAEGGAAGGGDGSDNGLGGGAASDAMGSAGQSVGGALAGSIAPGAPDTAAMGGTLGALNAAQGLGSNAIGAGEGQRGFIARAMPGLIGTLLQHALAGVVPGLGPAFLAGNLISKGLTGQSLTGYMAQHGTDAPPGMNMNTKDMGVEAGGYSDPNAAAGMSAAVPAQQTPTMMTSGQASPWLQGALYGSGSTAGGWARGPTSRPLGG